MQEKRAVIKFGVRILTIGRILKGFFNLKKLVNLRCLQQRTASHTLALTIERREVIPNAKRKHETVVAGAAFHAFKLLFVRLALIIFIEAIVGILLTRKKA